jgi:hypothetical protein
MEILEEWIIDRLEVQSYEWRTVFPLVNIAEFEESEPLGQIVVAGDGQHRIWCAASRWTYARIVGERDSRTTAFSIPPRIVVGSSAVCENDSATELLLVDFPNLGPHVVLRGDGGSIAAPVPYHQFPAWVLETDFSDGFPVHATVDSERLATGLSASLIKTEIPSDPDQTPLRTFGIGNDCIWFKGEWATVGPTVVEVSAKVSASQPPKQINTRFLSNSIELHSNEISISFGESHDSGVVLSSDGVTTFVRAKPTTFDEARWHVEKTVDTVFGPDSLVTDADGDYRLKNTGVPVWARLVPGDPHCLRVFSTVAIEMSSSPALLSEINELNQGLQFARLDHGNEILTASADLVASTLDPDELYTAFSRVSRVASDVGPSLIALFGGSGVSEDDQRWAQYLDTIVYAELVPNSHDALNGVEAIDPWIFDTPVYVLTGWNPQNITRFLDENNRANLQLGSRLGEIGARYAHATGQSRDGEWNEPSFLIWNLSFDEAIDLANEFRQEAIFEITNEEFRLVHVASGRRSSVSRFA